MPQVIGTSLSFCVLLLILASCGGPDYQVRHPLGYGERPPEDTWVAVDSAYQSPSREMIYYDPKTIRRDGDRVTLWQLTDYKSMQGNAPFGSFMSKEQWGRILNRACLRNESSVLPRHLSRRHDLLPQFPAVELLCDAMLGGKTYGSDLASLDRYFFHFAMAARVGR